MLSIPEPCYENWDAMTPEAQGRFCGKCCKVVVDFTNMPTQDVIAFLSEKKAERVCGRFRSGQVQAPHFGKGAGTFSSRIKIFLSALVLVFGATLFTGCHHSRHAETMGKISSGQSFMNAAFVSAVPDTTKKTDTVKKNRPVKNEQVMMGKVSCRPKNEK